jgi:hypothetical protein
MDQEMNNLKSQLVVYDQISLLNEWLFSCSQIRCNAHHLHAKAAQFILYLKLKDLFDKTQKENKV